MQLFLIFYVLPVLLTTDPAKPMVLPAFVIAVIGISINSSAYLAEMFRGGIQSLDKGQFEAGRSLGFSNNQTLKLIVIPQAIKNIMPTLGNEFIVVIKETAVISLVGGKDILYYGKQIGSTYYNLFPSLAVATLIYYVIVKFFIFLLRKYEIKISN
jgi:polar amino acid transport system permease protein